MVLEKLRKEQKLTERVLLDFINEMREFKTDITKDVNDLREGVNRLLEHNGLPPIPSKSPSDEAP